MRRSFKYHAIITFIGLILNLTLMEKGHAQSCTVAEEGYWEVGALPNNTSPTGSFSNIALPGYAETATVTWTTTGTNNRMDGDTMTPDHSDYTSLGRVGDIEAFFTTVEHDVGSKTMTVTFLNPMSDFILEIFDIDGDLDANTARGDSLVMCGTPNNLDSKLSLHCNTYLCAHEEKKVHPEVQNQGRA